MKRTLNSVHATTTSLCSQSLPVPEKVERLSIPLFPFSPFVFLTFDSLSCFNHGSATKYAIVFASIGLRKHLRREEKERERQRKHGQHLAGPAKVDCGKIRLGKRLVHRRLGRTCSPCALIPPPDRRLNYGAFFGEVVMNAIISKSRASFRRVSGQRADPHKASSKRI